MPSSMPMMMTSPTKPSYVPPPAALVPPLSSKSVKGVLSVQFQNMFVLSAPNSACKGCASAKGI